MRKFNIKPSGIIELPGLEMVKACLMENIGFAYTPEQNFANELEAGELKTLKTALGEVTIGRI